MLLASKFDPVEIEKERGVIIEEINMYEDTPMRKVGDLYENLLYGDTKLGRDIAGRKEVIKSVKREDFLSYIDHFYSPKNTVITIAGGIGDAKTNGNFHINEDQIVSVVNGFLGGWMSKKVPKPEIMQDALAEPKVLVKFVIEVSIIIARPGHLRGSGV